MERSGAESDPRLKALVQNDLAAIAAMEGRFGEAREGWQKALEIDTNFGPAHFVLGCVYQEMKLYGEAIAELQIAANVTLDNPAMLASLGRAHALAGHTSEAETLLAQLQERSKQSYVPPYNIGVIYAGLGQKKEALACLEKSYEEHSIWLIFLKCFAAFDSLRQEPGFVDLMRRLGLAD